MRKNRKYYGVLEDDDKSWDILFNYVIDKCAFLEFGIWVDTTDSYWDDIKKHIPEMPDLLREDRPTQFKNAYNDLKQIGFQDNIVYFYSTKRIFNRVYPYDWHIARLQLDERLKASLKAKKSLMDYIDLETNNHSFEFNDPAFYEDEETALMFCIHSEMKAYILLEDEEKTKLEQQGIKFSDEIEQLLPTDKKDILTLNEIKAL